MAKITIQYENIIPHSVFYLIDKFVELRIVNQQM